MQLRRKLCANLPQEHSIDNIHFHCLWPSDEAGNWRIVPETGAHQRPKGTGEKMRRAALTTGSHQQPGNALLCFVLVQAAQAAIRYDADWRRQLLHLAMGRERRIAKMAIARKPSVHRLRFRICGRGTIDDISDILGTAGAVYAAD